MQAICSTLNPKPETVRSGQLLDFVKLEAALSSTFGDMTLHEAYEKTGRIINIVVSATRSMPKP